MLYRVIVRVSLTSDAGSTVRNSLAPFMSAAGLQNTETGTWESEATELAQAAASLSEVLATLGAQGDPSGCLLKHVWIYIDRPRSSDPSEMEHVAEALLGPDWS